MRVQPLGTTKAMTQADGKKQRGKRSVSAVRLAGQFAVLDGLGLVGVFALSEPEITFIFVVVSFEPDHFGVSFESQNMGRNLVQEEAIVADDHGTTRESEQCVF